ncbi:MAG: ArnT family glycosyltransferase [Myxococcota bacterium]
MHSQSPNRLWIVGLACVVLGGLALRAPAFERGDFFGYHSWRMGDSAAFTTNYLAHSLNPFDPRISRYPCSETGHPFGQVEAELPVVAWLAALPLAALGADFPPAWYLRAIALLFYIGTCIYLALFVRRLGGSAAEGVLTAAAFSTLPLAVYFTVSPQPDGPSLFFAVATMFHLDRWIDRWQPRDAVLSAMMGAVVVLLKISNGMYLAVALYLAVNRLGIRGIVQRWSMWAWALAVLAPAGAWYAYSHVTAPFSFEVYGKISSFEELRDVAMWEKWAERLPWHSFTWGGLMLAIVGLASQRGRRVGVVMAWFGAVLLYTAVALPPQVAHSYYQLPITIPASMAIAAGVISLWRRGWAARGVLAITLALHGFVASHVLFGDPERGNVEVGFFTIDLPHLRRAAELVREHVPKHELFVQAKKQPAVVHNSGRRAWTTPGRLPAVLRCMEEGGASHALVPAGWRIPPRHGDHSLHVLARKQGHQVIRRAPAPN